MINLLLQPFEFEFMINAFLISIAISIPASILSCYLILKGWSLMGDAISHAVLPGIVVAYIINIPLIIGAFIAGLLCTFFTGFISDNSRVKQDTVMGVVFSGMFAVGIVIYTKIDSNLHLDHILFGNMLGINKQDLIITSIITTLISIVIFIKWKDLLVFCFDPIQSKALGLNIKYLHYGLLILLSLTIVTILKAVGIILAISLLITPGAIAFLITKKFSHMLLYSIIISTASTLSGVYMSFYIDSAPAPTIVLVMTIVFIITFIISSFKKTYNPEYNNIKNN
ncbi:metal ABC transporter permease [Hyphomicrobiales bacterium]|nr:metal ABC transporter permease [Rhodobiaceae bacterium]MBT6223677.1 metal ABC transporter permease [Rhodobiaceae bacterium]MDB4831265.1 metal ABC transporter permease [Hyphomicrobiales bacterium]MDC0139527.1 metal ABC transporter permease [Hyphomicrobiales bacterium]